MGLQPGQPLLGHPVDVVFIGSCTNGRLSDLRQAASLLKGRKVAAGVRVLVVPGSQQVKRQAEAEGLDRIFNEAGAEWREPGCSMCIAMNGDQLEPGQYAVSTSNRNFEGRQGKGGRTFLASPLTAAAAAVTGQVTDPAQVGPMTYERHLPHSPPAWCRLPVNDIDTDQIIPARFLKATDKAGLGDSLFADWRYLTDGSPNPDFVLNQPESQGAQILLAGDNFGCGSSREHAPWALIGFGFRAVISTSFADIFRNNALKNGLLPVIVDPEDYRRLSDLLAEEPRGRSHHRPGPADSLSCRMAARSISRSMRFAKTCLLNGVDELGYLLGLGRQNRWLTRKA